MFGVIRGVAQHPADANAAGGLVTENWGESWLSPRPMTASLGQAGEPLVPDLVDVMPRGVPGVEPGGVCHHPRPVGDRTGRVSVGGHGCLEAVEAGFFHSRSAVNARVE